MSKTRRVTLRIRKEIEEIYNKNKEENPDYTWEDAIEEYYRRKFSKKEDDDKSDDNQSSNIKGVHPYEQITAKALENVLLNKEKKKETPPPIIYPPPSKEKNTKKTPPPIIKLEGSENIDTSLITLIRGIEERLERLEEEYKDEKLKQEMHNILSEYLGYVDEVVEKKVKGIDTGDLQKYLTVLHKKIEELERKLEEENTEENISAEEIIQTLSKSGTLKDLVRLANRFIERGAMKDTVYSLTMLSNVVGKWKEAGLSVEEITEILKALTGGKESEGEY